MAHKIEVAAPRFETRAERGSPEARETVLKETKQLLASLADQKTDLTVLSEGIGALSQTPDQAENLKDPGPIISLYQEFAVQLNCYIVGSAKRREEDKIFNSAIFIEPGGNIVGAYDKVFLTESELESGLIPGTGPRVFKTSPGRLGAMICFDLNFDTLRNAYAAKEPDILAFPSMFHGGILQAKWAINCQCFVVSAMQVEGGGIMDPFGRFVARTHCYTRVARATINLDYALVHLDNHQEKLKTLQRDLGKHITVDIPPNIGRIMIINNTREHDLDDLLREYEIERVNDYLNRLRETNDTIRPGGPTE